MKRRSKYRTRHYDKFDEYEGGMLANYTDFTEVKFEVKSFLGFCLFRISNKG